MSLREFATAPESKQTSVTVLNRELGAPVSRFLRNLLDQSSVTIREATTETLDSPSDVVLVHAADEPTIAVSPIERLCEELLMVNSDLYVSGARGLEEIETPDVIKELSDIPFTVSGGSGEAKEKLLLIQISRHIEAMAWKAGEGRLATGFQHLSRLNDERGTREVYERLAIQTDVDTHIYGAPDRSPSISEITVHGTDTREIRSAWFVVYQSAHHPKEGAALVAYETDPATWKGSWTYDPDRIASILDYLDGRYSDSEN